MLTVLILPIFLSFLKISNTPDQGSTGGGGSEILNPIICEMFSIKYIPLTLISP